MPIQVGGQGVASFNARTGAVVATTGDYTAAQVTNALDKSASDQVIANPTVVSYALELTDPNSTGSSARLNLSANAGAQNTYLAQGPSGLFIGQGGTPAGTRDLLQLTSTALATKNNCVLDARAAGAKLNPVTSGALSTISPSTGTGIQCSTARDVFLHQICTFNPTAGASATCVVAISPDNVTYSTLVTVTIPAGVTFDGTIPPIGVQVPAGWYVKFTTTNATLGTGTWY